MPIQEDLEQMGYTGYPYIRVPFTVDRTKSLMRIGYAAMSNIMGVAKAMIRYSGSIYDSCEISTEHLTRFYRQSKKIRDQAERMMDWCCSLLGEIVAEHEINERVASNEDIRKKDHSMAIEHTFSRIVNRSDLTLEEFKQVPSGGFVKYRGVLYDVKVTEKELRDQGYLIVIRDGCAAPTAMKYKDGITLPRHRRNNNL